VYLVDGSLAELLLLRQPSAIIGYVEHVESVDVVLGLGVHHREVLHGLEQTVVDVVAVFISDTLAKVFQRFVNQFVFVLVQAHSLV